MAKILIVDDDEGVRFSIRKVLGSENYTLDEADDGVSCLEKIKSDRPDLILLDVMMPTMDGWNVLEEINRMGDPVPVIMLTVIKPPVEMRPGDLEGIVDYMKKPFDNDDIKERVKRALTIIGVEN
jgi:CheY-like chemotaxis protein